MESSGYTPTAGLRSIAHAGGKTQSQPTSPISTGSQTGPSPAPEGWLSSCKGMPDRTGSLQGWAGERRSGINRVIGDRKRAQRAAASPRVLQHLEQVSRSISRTCRFFVSRTLFYEWRRRCQPEGLEGLKPVARARVSPFSDSAAHRSAGASCTAGTPVRDPDPPAAALPPAMSCPLSRPFGGSWRVPRPSRLPEAVPTRSEAAARPARPRGSRSRWTSSISRRGRVASTNSPQSMEPHATAFSRSTTTTIHSVRHSLRQRTPPGVPRRDPADSDRYRVRMGLRLHLASA